MSYISKIFNAPFFQNRFVLYASLFLVLLGILRHISNKNINAVVLMALIGLVTSYFSKNMIIVLLTAFATVFVLEMIGFQGVTEGMKSKKEGEKTMGQDEDENENEDEDKTEKSSSKPKSKSDVKKEEKEEEPKKETKKGGSGSQDTLNATKNQDTTKKQGMKSLSPANYDGKNNDDDNIHSAKEANRIDYASTLEQAYDNIENIIGEDGVRGLTDQTKSLMNQQKQLMENMKEMGPLLKSAEGFMEQITGGGGISGITNMLQGLATPAAKK
jgi:hypothetical protein